MTMLLGIDIGGTKVAVGVADDAGRLLARERRATAALGDGEALLAGLERLADTVLAAAGSTRAAVTGVGLALPGPVDRARGVMEVAQSLRGLEGLPLAARFSAAFDAPATAENDANAAALGEARCGAGRGARMMLYFTISTGIGGGIVVDGQLWTGSAGHAAEFGHQLVVLEDGLLCSCGGHGCLETVASGPAIARRAREMAAIYPESRLGALLAEGGPEAITAETAAAAAREGDAAARKLWEAAGRDLGIGVANVIVLFDPDCVVLGGGVMRAGELLLEPVRRYVAERAMPRLRRELRLVPAAFGDDAALMGALALAQDRQPAIAPG
jgi:glucokinase